LQALLRVRNLFGKYAGSAVVYAIGVTASIVLYWHYQLGLLYLVFCLLITKGAQLVVTYILCMDAFNGSRYQGNLVWKLVKNSWSFGLFSILGIFYFMVDTQIISLYLGAEEVALYQAVFRIVLILALFSDIISNVLLPYLSFKMANKKDMTTLLSKIFLYLLIIGCSLFLMFTSFKTELLDLLYTPEYRKATVLVLPFSIVLILRTVSTLLGNLLTISNKQVYRVITVGISLVVSLALNLVLIPKYGIPAAAWTSVLVHLVLFGMYYWYGKKEVPTLRLHSPSNILVLIMTGILYGLINYTIADNLLIVLACALLWILFVLVIMKRDNNLGFLRQVLREKGAG
jgi:O-antigen/teichoic acid export membrane protein